MDLRQESPNQFLPAGALIGNRYKVIRPLGSGGMASVYLAEDIVLGESTVAVKVLRRTNNFKEDILQRFLREVRLTHKINHENVVRTFDFGQDDNTLFYTMEYLPGTTLDSIFEEPSTSIETVLAIALQLMRGIAAVHSVGVIHRDLKPANVMMLPGGRLKIADFGIARAGTSMLTADSGEIVGTISYLAPEVLTGADATIAVDYYAVGVILYQLLTQRLPIDDEIPARLVMRKVEEVPVDIRELRQDTPDWLAEGIMGLLSLEPHARMKKLSEFARNLDQFGPKNAFRSLSSEVAPDTLNVDEILIERPGLLRDLRKVRHGPIISKMALSVLAGLVTLLFLATETSSMIEFAQYDNLFYVRGARPARADVVIVSIDEPSYSALGVPLNDMWPRALHAKLLDRLYQDGARRAVFDILFAEPSSDPAVDDVLAEAMGRVPTVLGAVSGFSHQTTLNGSYMLEELIKPAPVFASKALSVGITGLPIEYGRVRAVVPPRSPMFPEVPSLAEAASGIYDRTKLPGERALINFYGPTHSVATMPYYMAVADDRPLPQGFFKDKVVFIGLNLKSRTGPSQRETFATPFDQITYGTEIHATAASNILSGDWLAQLPRAQELAIGFLLAALMTFGALRSRGVALLTWILVGVFAVGAAQFALFTFGVAVPVVGGIAVGALCGLLFRVMLSMPLYPRGQA